MRQRHLSNSFTRSGIDPHGNNNHTPTEQSYFPTGRGVASENGSFVGQMNHMTRHHNSEGRANVSMEMQPYVPVDPYSHSTTETRSLTHVGHAHCTNYNAPSMRDVEADLSNHPTGNGGPFKRKRSSSFYSEGESSSSSSHIPMEKPSVDFQSAPSYRSSLTIHGEDLSRNVRRRYRLDLEPGIARSHVPTHSSQFYHSSLGQHANGGHWNCVPPYGASSQRRIPPSDMSGGSRHEMNQVHVGGTSGDQFFSRHPASSSHGPTIREDHVNHSRRSEPSYSHSSRYSHYAHGGTSSTDGLHAPDAFSSRNCSGHYSPGGWRGSYRSGRQRLTVDRFPPVLETTESHGGTGHHETIMMVDQAPFYGNSRNFSDQYRDMRLDIDNMSYEELLNLGERIGSVNTGLSEDNMSKYLMEKVYCSDENLEEVSCPICLEEYKNGEKIGKMGKCGHDYHLVCIKKWLLMKKLCPICKTECSN